ncbi:MAG: VOC family protein [Chloroflexota bacterium]
MFKGVHHIGYFVSDIDATIKRYQELYGGVLEICYRNEANNQTQAFVRSGNTRVELMQPDDQSKLHGSTAQVIHHVGYEVDDIEQAMAEMRAKGVRFLDETPVTNPLGWKIAYFDGGDLLGVAQHLAQHK